MKKEQELDLFRKECLETLLYTVKERKIEAVKEAGNTYRIAINSYTTEYLNNRPYLYNNNKLRKNLKY